MSRGEIVDWIRLRRRAVVVWASLVTVLGGLLTATQGFRSWDDAGLWTPASRGWVRGSIRDAQDLADRRWIEGAEKTRARLDELAAAIKAGQKTALRTQLDVVDAALARYRAERVDLQTQIDGAPTTAGAFRRRLAEVDAEIARLEQRWAQTACDLAVLRGDRPAC